MKTLTNAEISDFVSSHAGWTFTENKLIHEFRFKDFVAAIAFVNAVARVAEEAGHHPDIDIRYNRVLLGLTTHDAGGVTERDASMAGRLSAEFPV